MATSKDDKYGKGKPGTSNMILSPPGSGFPFSSFGGSALLMPVSQPDSALMQEDPEVDSFIQQTQPNDPKPFTFFQSSENDNSSTALNATRNLDPFTQIGHEISSTPSVQSHQVSGKTPFGVEHWSPQMFSPTPPVPMKSSSPSLNTQQLHDHSQYPSSETSDSYSSNPISDFNPPQHMSSFQTFDNSNYSHQSENTYGNFYNVQPTESFSASPQNTTASFTPPTQSHPPLSSPSNQVQHFAHSEETYKPIPHHWFFCKIIEKKPIWIPFSLLDSVHLEEIYVSGATNDDAIVATDGGRYDVDLNTHIRGAVYWEEEPSPVRRCSWFYRLEGERSFTPYEEHFSEKLEEEYRIAVTTNTWHRRLEFPDGETIVIHNPSVIVHYQPANQNEWETVPEVQIRPRIVKRGIDDIEIIEDGESMQIDHLVFVVHGIGAVCDLKFRTLPEVVDDFRNISNSLLQSHYSKHISEGQIGRIEFIPVSWHKFLHGDATGIDFKLKPITLKSIPKLRHFANDTILDVLFYTSPVYCQAIISQVASEINRLYQLFLSRNIEFIGKVSFAGHSLGSVVLFDLLLHQADTVPIQSGESVAKDETATNEGLDVQNFKAIPEDCTLEYLFSQLGIEEFVDNFKNEDVGINNLKNCTESKMELMGIPPEAREKLLSYVNEKENKVPVNEKHENESSIPKAKPKIERKHSTINYVVGLAGTGQPYVTYPRLDFEPTCFFALGSPVAMFLTVRGSEPFKTDFRLPTCPSFFNIFHPFDPVAYRLESLIDPLSIDLKPVLIPHHKGRKRMHLEIKESLSRVGADLKQKFIESLRSTWNTINDFARAHRTPSAQAIEAELMAEADNAIEELKNQHQKADDNLSSVSNLDGREDDFFCAQLNGGRRVDYVLQEKPIESFNEYLFALQSHTCYWESEDTVLLMIKEIYAGYGIYPNPQGPETFSAIPSVKPSMSYNQTVPLLQRNDSKSYSFPTTAASNIQIPFQSHETNVNVPISSALPPHLYNTAEPPNMYPTNFTSVTTPNYPSSNTDVQYQGSTRNFGMDPTAPPSSNSTIGPPPLTGFVRQAVVRK